MNFGLSLLFSVGVSFECYFVEHFIEPVGGAVLVFVAYVFADKVGGYESEKLVVVSVVDKVHDGRVDVKVVVHFRRLRAEVVYGKHGA